METCNCARKLRWAWVKKSSSFSNKKKENVQFLIWNWAAIITTISTVLLLQLLLRKLLLLLKLQILILNLNANRKPQNATHTHTHHKSLVKFWECLRVTKRGQVCVVICSNDNQGFTKLNSKVSPVTLHNSS